LYKGTNIYINKVDFEDCFSTKFTNSKDISIVELTAATFEFPNWIKALFYIRNKAVVLFGLQNDISSSGMKNLQNMHCVEGEDFGIFNVKKKTNDTIVMFAGDKHLDAIFVVERRKENNNYFVSFETIVQFNNKLGNFYFFFVKPFHKLIVYYLVNRIKTKYNNK